MDRKKELKEQYRQMRTEMGVFVIYSKGSNKCYIEATQDLRGTMNGTRFKLGAGVHLNRELQKEWKEFGEGNFITEILGKLEYDKDETKTDYREDLALLRMIWEENLLKQNKEFYSK